MMKLDKLFTPMKIGNCEIPNRLVVSAMVTNFNNPDGTATERYIAYHERKAKGGWGLIITENYSVSPHAMGYKYIGGLWNDGQIESHKKLTERIHQYDSKIFCQLYLKAHRRPLYLSLLTSCGLPRYLHEFDECCNETYEKMMRDYAVKEGVTEQLKAENALEWAGRMNSIRNRVEEVIFHDFVYAGGGAE